MAYRVLLCLSHDFSYCSVSRVLAIEEALIEAGHKCAIVANQSHIDRLPQRDGMLFSAPSIDMESLVSCPFAISSCADYLAAIGFNDFGNIESTYSSISNAIEHYRPDVIIADFCAIGAIAACAYQIPLISTLRWTYHAMNPENQIDNHPQAGSALNAFNRLLSNVHLEGTHNLSELIYRGASQLIVPSIPIFEPGIEKSPDVHWLGPLVSRRLEQNNNTGGWSNINREEKRLYVYLDPAVVEIPEQFRLLSEAFGDSDWSIRVSVPRGFKIEPEKENTVIDCIIQPPGQLMIELADIYITHCGPNSAQMSILKLTPVVAIPGDGLERKFNATVLEQLGLAKVLEFEEERFTPEKIRDLCEYTLSLTPNENATSWSKHIQKCKGASAIPEMVTHIGKTA